MNILLFLYKRTGKVVPGMFSLHYSSISMHQIISAISQVQQSKIEWNQISIRDSDLNFIDGPLKCLETHIIIEVIDKFH